MAKIKKSFSIICLVSLLCINFYLTKLLLKLIFLLTERFY